VRLPLSVKHSLSRVSTPTQGEEVRKCGHVHDKPDRAMSEHLVSCQLPRPILSARSLEYDPCQQINRKERTALVLRSPPKRRQQKGGGSIMHVRTFCNAFSMFALGTPSARAFLMTLDSVTFLSGSTDPPSKGARTPQKRRKSQRVARAERGFYRRIRHSRRAAIIMSWMLWANDHYVTVV
jgi:hypothetical protein